MKGYPGSVHNHTDFSNLRLRDSINRVDDVIDYAIELGHECVAFTEHETVANAIKVQKKYKKIKKDHPEFKVILGNEIYLCRDGLTAENFDREKDSYYHFILLAKDAEGHRQIRELSSRAWARSWMNGRMRRVPTYYQDLIDVVGANPGHVIASTACLGGFLPKAILRYVANPTEQMYTNIKGWCLNVQNIFGKGNFYLEMQPSKNKEQIIVNKALKKLSEELNIKYIITTDSHYLKKEDAPIHKAYLNSQEGDREVDEFYATTYMMGTEELESFFDYFTREEIDKAYEAIKEIKDKCEDYELAKELKIPNLPWVEQKYVPEDKKKRYIELIPKLADFNNSEFNSDKKLVDAIINGIESHADLQNQEAYNEINNNLEMTWTSSRVNSAEWSAYFLNLQRIIDVCWEAGSLVGCGRGSGVGFILLYVLGITQINPLAETTKTFPWRFLNPDRVSVLDVDVDIEGGRRSDVLNKLREVYGLDRVCNVATFGTEKSKSAIQTAARGLGIDVDEAAYISSLVPADRGQIRTLHQCYYGDEENGFDPVPLFVKEMNNNPELWEVAQKVEGLICRIGEHAGGVIFVDEDFTNSTALMRAPNGDIITQFDLHDDEAVSLIKYDLLSVEALDKIHTCLDLLTEDGYIDKNLSLRDRYENTIGIYKLNRDNQDMWKMIWNHQIQSLFQMEKQSGIKGIATLKPTSVDDLAILNSTIRLMAQPGSTEMPTDKLARFKRDPSAWDRELASYGLGINEKIILEPIVGISYGLCLAQEQFMSLVQLPALGGFSLTWADKLRKSIAKKNPKEFEELTKEFYQVTKEKGVKENFAKYVWEVLISMSKGYGFNQSHTLAYSLIGLQEMNLCFNYPIIYWNCACAITDSGGIGTGTDYNKVAITINKMKNSGIKVKLPDINKSAYEFKPNKEDGSIFCGLKSLANVGDEIVMKIIENRPYSSVQDFYDRVKPTKQVMVSLIKGGAFDAFMQRKICMAWFIWNTCDKKKRLTLQNMAGLIKYNLVPTEEADMKLAVRVFEFNRYLKAMCKFGTDKYKLDERAINFLIEIGADNLVDQDFIISKTSWDNVYQKYMNTLRDWLSKNKEETLIKLNELIFLDDWNKYAKGTISDWEMDALCFYYHEHPLSRVNAAKYSFADFFSMPEDPVVDRTFVKGDKEIKMFVLKKICGTCIAKDKNKSTVSLLTPTGVVTVKMSKGLFSLYDKQISVRNPDGTKTIKEKSWFNRGSKIVVQGIRTGEEFFAKKYASSGGHHLYKIDEIEKDGDLILRHERYQGEVEDE